MIKKYEKVQKLIQKEVYKEIYCREWNSSIILEGQVESWDMVIKAGKLASKRGYKGVVNQITVKGLKIPIIKAPIIRDSNLNGKRVDVLIIGGGVIGCAIARELAKWEMSILLLEKESDLAMHTSSRNDGMIHPGIEAPIGSKKSIFNVRGNELYSKITKELGVPFERCGSTVLFDRGFIRLAKPYLMSRARKAGVKDVVILNKAQVKKIEPNVTENIVGAVHFGTTGILSPYRMTYAFAENAAMNGVDFSLDTLVESFLMDGNEIIGVNTNRGLIYPKVIINAAGIFADKIANMAHDQFFTIHPRKGETLILDRKKGSLINGVVAKPSLNLTKGNTKGGGIIKTIDGNILVGPDAYEQPFREDYSTNSTNIENILRKHLPVVPKLSNGDVITYYAGIRAATYEEDFIIERSECVDNLIYAAGIQSPGLASAPAIAEEIEKITCRLLAEKIQLKKKDYWNPIRKAIPEVRNMSFEEKAKLIKEKPEYGEIICRCEEISKGEVQDALRSPIKVDTVDAIKRRVKAGAGRCQGGFCLPQVLKIINEEYGKSFDEITKKGKYSNILIEKVQSKYNNLTINDNEVKLNERQ
ncbi:NAD(P)/FAD-dependent oxidoreductase [Clostridium sp. UBA3061]|uniref:NAD(P)/FAD-dependent oxidoreductase n=1 Tax=Clostridium sp. UBA3061 TaxID=1946353 RepID=UPI0032170100